MNARRIVLCSLVAPLGFAWALDFTEFGESVGSRLPRQVTSARVSVSRYEIPAAEKDAGLGAALSAELVAWLAGQQVRLVERDDLPRVLREREMARKAAVKGKVMAEPLQADFLVSGNVYRIAAGNLRVVTRVIDTQTLAVVHVDETIVVDRQSSGVVSGFHTHDGFYFNAFYGLGYQSTAVTNYDQLSALSLAGGAGLAGVKAGWSLPSNWIISLNIATLLYGTLGNPRIQSTPDIVTEKASTGKELNVTFIGPNLTHYFGANWFATATVAPASMVYRDASQQTRIRDGFGAMLGMGREWWVSDNWGIGFALLASYSRIEFNDLELALTTTQGTLRDKEYVLGTWSLVLAVSASYN